MSESERGGIATRVARQLRDVWAIAGISLLGILILNGILRNVLPGTPPEPAIDPEARRLSKKSADAYGDAGWVAEYYEEFEQANETRWEPYTYWRRQPFDGRHIHIDEEGLRRTWNADPAASAREIWVLGGSTTWGTGVRDDHTLPSELSRALDRTGRAVRVTNLGEAGYVSTQELIGLMHRLQGGRRPDLVVFYDGVNDVYAAFQEGRAGLTLNESNRRRELNSTRDWGRLLRGAVARLEGLGRLAIALGGKPPPERPSSLGADVVARYEANVRAAESLAAVYGFDVLFVWQPTLFTKRAVTEFERRTRDSRIRTHRDLQLEANRRVAASTFLSGKTNFVDLSSVLDDVGEPMYIDFCHLAEDGNRRVAEALLPAVVGALDRQRATGRAGEATAAAPAG